MLVPGLRVVRGPDWIWQNQDGGDGYIGTVCEVGRSGSSCSPDKTVVVQWDSGNRTNYRVGYQGHYDLRVIDNAQIGVKHPNIICDGCKKHGIAGMRYHCIDCHDYDLCSLCYHADKHELTHHFHRFDSANAQGVELPVRKAAVKCHLRGIFVGARVMRGHDWEWGNQDGGEGKTGRVMDIRGWDTESARSVANVTWTSGATNVYRLGHKGNCDLKFVQEASGGYYYRDHIPILGQHIEPSTPARAQTSRPNHIQFGVGDKVRVDVDVETLKMMQQGHGGWNQRMAEYIGKMGTVHRVTVRGDIRVQHEGCNNRWTYNPAALVKVNCFSVGDVVCVVSDMARVKELQKGHGEWIDIMKNLLGKLGKVIKVYGDGDLRIQLDGTAWTLNPACVRLLPGSATELSNTMHADQNQRAEPSMSWLPGGEGDVDGTTGGLAERLVRDAAHGRLDAVRRTLETLRGAGGADVRAGGRSALQVAAHQGHIDVVRELLAASACVNAADADGDTTLHYAAFGNRPEIVEILLDHGANINALNKGRCTALHIAAHKQPAQCVGLLLARGADVNIQDSYGDTALHDAIGKESNEVIEMLCNTPGMDFTLRNKRGFNVLHHASLKGVNFATKTLLSKTRQLVNVKKDDGFAALHLAALNGHHDVVETLVKIGQADINLRNNRNQTALLLAVSQGHCGVIELLVRLRADVNAQDEDGDTALHLAIIKRANLNVELSASDAPSIFAIYERLARVTEYRTAIAIASYLVRAGCGWAVTNVKGQTALDLLQDVAKADIIKSYRIDEEENERRTGTEFETENIVVDLAALNLPGNDAINNKRTVHQRCNSSEGYNLTAECNSPKQSPARQLCEIAQNRINGSGFTNKNNQNRVDEPFSNSSRAHINAPDDSTNRTVNHCNEVPLINKFRVTPTVGNDGSPVPDELCSRKPVECAICSELSEQNVSLEPCGHRPACEDCVARLKKCLHCGIAVTRRITRDGRIIPPQSKQPCAERMRYLECKVAEIEETHGCSICMERRRNVVFLCGHGACSKCADTLKTCHMCRKTITKKIPLY